MSTNKKSLNLLAVAAVLTISFVISLTQFRGASMQNIIVAIAYLAVYVLLIASYLSRIALILFGVFAVYKMLRERINVSDISG